MLLKMLPYLSFISWRIGPLTIQSFGLMMALGFLVGIYLFAKQFKTESEKEIAHNLGIIVMVFGVLGSRLFFLIENPGSINSFWEFFNVWEGGLSWFGGFMGALAGCIVYLRLKKLNFWGIADKMAPSIAIGHAFGRIGCILGDGGHVGKLTTMPWGFNINGEIRHVTAWYELAGLLALFGALLILRKRRYYKGFLFHFYLVGYSLIRFVSDFLRADRTYFGLTAAQYICVPIFAIGLGLILINLKRRE